MNFAEQQRSPLRHVVGLGIVVLFHIALIYALVNGLGQSIVDVIKPPLQAKIVKDTKPPPPDAPPPPPPVMAQPPPPYVPPPDIQIANPTPVNNAITQTTTVAPPAAPMHPSAPPSTAPAVPDRDVSASAIPGQAKMEYPADMLDEEREGVVRVTCDVDVTGSTSGCQVTSSSGASFARTALQYASSHRYRPAVHNGVAVASPRHTFVITFKLGD